ncbi:hypothetical protein JCM24511_06129 [Saitozyma sp. JCM 24511]|nr:hypothetical protein JCM24511_06129 [Saitozyma sp. JCM 24511]
MEERFLALRKRFPPDFQSLEEAQELAKRLNAPNVCVLFGCVLTQKVVFEYFLLRMCDQSHILRLHRPYQVMGYENDKYRYSTERCIQAAKAILLDFHAAWIECPSLLYFFIHMCYGLDSHKRQSDRNLILQTIYVLRMSAPSPGTASAFSMASWPLRKRLRCRAGCIVTLAKIKGIQESHHSCGAWWRKYSYVIPWRLRLIHFSGNSASNAHLHALGGSPSCMPRHYAVVLVGNDLYPDAHGVDFQYAP